MKRSPDDWKFQRRRARLVEEIGRKGIDDPRVLEAIGRVPRHLFVDPALRGRAYLDEALPIGLKQTISQPFTVAYQTTLLEIEPGDKVLEIGTGSGYQSAVLVELGADVYTVERLDPLYRRTKKLLHELGYRVKALCADGTAGWNAFGPYDAIVVTAGASSVPYPLLHQLREPDDDHRGGRLIIPIGGREGQRMNRFVRPSADDFDQEELEGFSFVPLVSDQQR